MYLLLRRVKDTAEGRSQEREKSCQFQRLDSLVQLGLGFFNHCFNQTKRSKNVTLEFLVYISLTFSCTKPVLGHSKKKVMYFKLFFTFLKELYYIYY